MGTTNALAHKRVIISTALGTRGDIQPFIGIALELRNRGAKVTFLINDYFEDLIKSHGFHFQGIGTKNEYIEFHNDARLWDPKTDVFALGFSKIIRPRMEMTYDYVAQEYKKNKDLLIIGAQSLINGALMAAEQYSIPSVAVILAPKYVFSHVSPPAPERWLFPRWLPQNITRMLSTRLQANAQKYTETQDYFWEINGMRRVLGLAPIKEFAIATMFSKHHLQIGLFPGWFGMPASDWPLNLNLLGFPLFSSSTKPSANTRVDKFIQDHGKPILFTSGTGVYDLEDLFLEGKKICEQLNIPGLFVGNDNNIKKHLDTEKCLYVDYVDFNQVFPQCRLIVHHGGIGTLAQALVAGTPQLIRPLSFDQHDNADRVSHLGLGAHALPKQFKAKKIAPLINKIIESDKIKHNINRVAANIRMSNTIPKVCDLIENQLLKPQDKKTKENTVSAIHDIPLIPRKRGNGGLECIAMMLVTHYQGQSPNIGELRKQYRKFLLGMNLLDIHNVLTEHNVSYRTVQCTADHLFKLRLPCIIQWDITTYVVFVGSCADKFHIRDPGDSGNTKQIYDKHEFAWHYSEIALEFTDNSQSTA